MIRHVVELQKEPYLKVRIYNATEGEADIVVRDSAGDHGRGREVLRLKLSLDQIVELDNAIRNFWPPGGRPRA